MTERLKKRLKGGVPHTAGNNKKNKTVKNKKVEYEHKGIASPYIPYYKNQVAKPKARIERGTAQPKYLRDVDNESTLDKIGNFIKKHNEKLKEAHDPKRLKRYKRLEKYYNKDK